MATRPGHPAGLRDRLRGADVAARHRLLAEPVARWWATASPRDRLLDALRGLHRTHRLPAVRSGHIRACRLEPAPGREAGVGVVRRTGRNRCRNQAVAGAAVAGIVRGLVTAEVASEPRLLGYRRAARAGLTDLGRLGSPGLPADLAIRPRSAGRVSLGERTDARPCARSGRLRGDHLPLPGVRDLRHRGVLLDRCGHRRHRARSAWHRRRLRLVVASWCGQH